MYGAPALKLHGKLVACMASHKSAEPGTLVVRIDMDQRADFIAAEPQIYYLTDHYVGYASCWSPVMHPQGRTTGSAAIGLRFVHEQDRTGHGLKPRRRRSG